MRFSAPIISTLCAAASVSAAVVEPFLAHRGYAPSNAFMGGRFGKRQTASGPATVPSQCTTTCAPVTNEISAGCPTAACCTPTFEAAYYNCLECVGTAVNTTDYTLAQDDLNALYMSCVDMGYDLPQLALPGQPASGSSSGAASPAPTGSDIFPSLAGATATPSSSSSSAKPATGAGVGAKRGVGVEVWGLIGAVLVAGVVGVW
ncbi:hypothetical protein BDN67DRAFT_1010723 [Paxillus ammoniavirescens]|nr:hypothetical protein BDN67DRAFT_1010723 [Paxillus ammoniavirescens]